MLAMLAQLAATNKITVRFVCGALAAGVLLMNSAAHAQSLAPPRSHQNMIRFAECLIEKHEKAGSTEIQEFLLLFPTDKAFYFEAAELLANSGGCQGYIDGGLKIEDITLRFVLFEAIFRLRSVDGVAPTFAATLGALPTRPEGEVFPSEGKWLEFLYIAKAADCLVTRDRQKATAFVAARIRTAEERRAVAALKEEFAACGTSTGDLHRKRFQFRGAIAERLIWAATIDETAEYSEGASQ